MLVAVTRTAYFVLGCAINSQREVFHTDRMAAHDGKALLPFDRPRPPYIARYRLLSMMSHVLSSDPGERGGSAFSSTVPCPLGCDCLDVSHSASGEISKQRWTMIGAEMTRSKHGMRCVVRWPPLRMMWDLLFATERVCAPNGRTIVPFA